MLRTTIISMAWVFGVADWMFASVAEPTQPLFDKAVNYGGLTLFSLAMFWLFREQNTKFFDLLEKQTNSFLGEIRAGRQDHMVEQKATRADCALERAEATKRYDAMVDELREFRENYRPKP